MLTLHQMIIMHYTLHIGAYDFCSKILKKKRRKRKSPIKWLRNSWCRSMYDCEISIEEILNKMVIKWWRTNNMHFLCNFFSLQNILFVFQPFLWGPFLSMLCLPHCMAGHACVYVISNRLTYVYRVNILYILYIFFIWYVCMCYYNYYYRRAFERQWLDDCNAYTCKYSLDSTFNTY